MYMMLEYTPIEYVYDARVYPIEYVHDARVYPIL